MKNIARWQLVSLLLLMAVVVVGPYIHAAFPTLSERMCNGYPYHIPALIIMIFTYGMSLGWVRGDTDFSFLFLTGIPMPIYYYSWTPGTEVLDYGIFLLLIGVDMLIVRRNILANGFTFGVKFTASVFTHATTFFLVGMKYPPMNRVSIVLLGIVISLIIQLVGKTNPEQERPKLTVVE